MQRSLPTGEGISRAPLRGIRIPVRRSLLLPDATPAISRLRPLLAERGLGTTLVEVLFSDNRTVRFRVLSRNPAAVQAVGPGSLPEHERVVEAWLDAQSGRAAA